MAFVTNLAGTLVTGVYVMGYPSGVDNDQGNLRAAGTIAETSRWTSSPLGEEERYVLISSGVNNTGVIGPSTLSTFNNQPGEVIVKYTTELAGVTDLTNTLMGPSTSGVYSIQQVDTIRTLNYKTSIVSGNWNIFSGVFDPALLSFQSGGWDIAAGVDDSANLRGNKTDVAANPTQAAPGRLTFLYGNPTPSGKNYAARSTW